MTGGSIIIKVAVTLITCASNARRSGIEIKDNIKLIAKTPTRELFFSKIFGLEYLRLYLSAKTGLASSDAYSTLICRTGGTISRIKNFLVFSFFIKRYLLAAQTDMYPKYGTRKGFPLK